MGDIWSKNEIDFIVENYKNMSNKEIANRIGRTKSAVDLKINRLGLKKSKYTYNIDFFENIDNEEKAYWLGFIAADGYISISKLNDLPQSYSIGIELSSRDNEHLRKFNKSIQGNLQISYRYKKSPCSDNIFSMCSIRLFSKKMVNDLINDGIVEKKSYILEFPILEERLERHFIRGYFDGDGSVFENKKRKCARCNFTSASPLFLESLRKILYKNNINSYICSPYKECKAQQLFIGGIYNVEKFRRFIYSDSNIYLNRKFNKFEYIYEKYDICTKLPRCEEICRKINRERKLES